MPISSDADSNYNHYYGAVVDQAIIKMMPWKLEDKLWKDFQPAYQIDHAFSALHAIYNPKWGSFKLEARFTSRMFEWTASAEYIATPQELHDRPSIAICEFLTDAGRIQARLDAN